MSKNIKKFNPKTGEWEVYGSTDAIDINLIDVNGNFKEKNVESALREISEKLSEKFANLEAYKTTLTEHSETLNSHEESIEWLMVNGGGGGGGGGNVIPTITSTFEDGTIVEKGTNVEIPIFFSSPNLGDGLAYIVIDGIEVNSVPIKQGNNKVNIGVLTNLNNEVAIYAKDRAGMLSNQLMWKIICGGIDLTIDFDSTADYGVTDTILMQFNIVSASSEPIVMHMTVDYDEYEIPCYQGHNEYQFKGLGVGIHKVTLYVTSGPYKTTIQTFNIVVVNAESLYISTTFTGGTFEFGYPISIDYRISKIGSEVFDVRLELDGELNKSLSVGAGTYYWTLNNIPAGDHKFRITADSVYGEHVEIEGTFTVIEGEYTPLNIIQSGLIYRLSGQGRTNNDSDRNLPKDNSGNGVRAELHNFNYFSNGWIDDALVCDGNAYVEIDCYPYSENAIYGSTIEVQFKGLDIGIFGSRIFDYTDIETPYKGVYIDLEETTMKSLANTGKITVDADTWITVSFVIDRQKKFGKIYIDGICSRAFSLSDTGSGVSAVREDFSHTQKIYLNSRKGEDKFGACEIRDVRIYSRVLSDDEIVQNFIAQVKDLKEQKALYDLNYNNTTLPTIKMYGDTTNMTLETPVTMRIKYTSPNEDKYGQSFDLPYCQVNWQGTSSLQYVLKNFTARLKDENMADYYYTPYPNGVPETVFCFKADYMESTHSRNAGLAKFVNECLYDEKNPAQLENANIRNSIDGFPTLLYINDELQGVYNFNLDRYSTNSFGYNDDTTLVYEVSANSDTTAGAFYKWSESSGKSELDYYKSDFECLYPPTRAAGNDNMDELIRLIEWVNDSSDEDFKDNIGRYFNLQYLLRYFLYVYVVGAVDSLGKNMKLTTWDGLVWYPQVYDADTTLGLDNTGFLKFDMDIEMGDEGVFNTTGSQLWKRVQLLFKTELEQQYAIMRQKYFTVENLMKYILEEQILKIPAVFYNKDMQTKYLDYGSSYLYALHGSGEHHIRKWLRERLIYCDTLFGYTVSTADYITLRSSKLGYVYLDIQTYIPMYVRVKWRDEANNTGVQVKRVARGETVRFEYNMPTATDQEIIVYAGYYLKSLGDVSNLQPTSMLIANASRLTEIECHSPNLINTDLSECTKLQRIDLSNSTILGTGIGAQPILNIQNCKYLRYCDCSNTQLTAIYTMQQGGNLEELYFPETTQVIQVTNQTYLRVLGIPYYCENLANVQITNCNAVQYIQTPFVEGDSLDFDTFRYVQNLTLTNSLDGLTEMSFSGFSKLRNVTLSSLSKLEKLGFDDMLLTSETSTIKNVTIMDCPLIDELTFNVTSDKYKVEFTEGIIDISGLPSCKTIKCNYSIKGLDKIILPTTIKNVYLSSEYGDGDNQLKNLWSSTARLDHEYDGFIGIDFKDLDLENFSMEGCNNLTTAINFFLTPVNSLPNLAAFESLSGWVNFDKYVGDVKYMFKGINFTFDDFYVIFNQPRPQNDITGLFQNAIITKAQFNSIITKFPNATIYDYFLEGSTIEEDYEFPITATSVIGAFKDCVYIKTYHENWLTNYNSTIISNGCYAGCINLPLDEIPASWGGYDFTSNVTTKYELTIPSDNYTITIDGNGGYIWNQTEGVIDWGEGSISDMDVPKDFLSKNAVTHTYAKAGVYILRGKFYEDNKASIVSAFKDVLTKVIQEPTSRTRYNNAYLNCAKLTSVTLPENIKPLGSLAQMFEGCTSLAEITGMDTWNTTNVNSMSKTFYGCSKLTNLSFIGNLNMSGCDSTSGCFAGTSISEIDVSNFNKQNKTSDVSYPNCGMFQNCTKLTKVNVSNLVCSTSTSIGDMFNGCTNLTEIIGMNTWVTTNLTDLSGAFTGVPMTSIDISNWTINSGLLQQTYNANSKIKTLIMNNVYWTDATAVNRLLSSGNIETIIMDEVHKNSTNFSSLFNGLTKLKSVTIQNAKPINSLQNLFNGCTALTEIIGGNTWDVSKATNINYAFYNCGLTNYNFLKNWNLKNCGNMSNTFGYIKATSLDLSGWIVPSAGISTMQEMFIGSKIKSLNISNFVLGTNTIVTNVLTSTPITTIIMNNVRWVNPAKVNAMLKTTTDLTTVTMDEVHTNSTNFDGIFANCPKIKNDIQLPENATSAIGAFQNCTGMTDIHSNWETYYPVGEFEIPAVGWWEMNYRVNALTGEIVAQNGHYASPFIELKSTAICSSTYTDNAYMRIAGYDENKNMVAAYDVTNQWWVSPKDTQYSAIGFPIEIIPRDDIKYIRISAASSYCILSTINIGIPSSNCYTGCTSITSIDDNTVDNGLDQIPVGWGGYDFKDGETAEIIIDTTGYANTVLDIFQRQNARLIDWGDGTIETYNGVTALPTSHTYTSEGQFRIKAKRWSDAQSLFECGSNSLSPKTGLKDTLIEVVRLDKAITTSKTRTFHTCKRLKKVNIDYTGINPSEGVTFFQYFYGCTSLEEVTFKFDFIYAASGIFQQMFNNCSSLKTINCNDWFKNLVIPVQGLAINEMFRSCPLLSELTPFKVSSKGDISISNLNYFCYGNTALTNVDGLENLDTSLCTNMNYAFYGCGNVSDFSPLTDWKFGKSIQLFSAFTNCYKMSSVEFMRNWNTEWVSNINQFINNIGVDSLEPLFNDNRDFSGITLIQTLLAGIDNVTTVDISCLKNVVSWTTTLSGMAKLEELTMPCQGTTFVDTLSGSTSLALKTVNFVNSEPKEGLFGNRTFAPAPYSVLENLTFTNVTITSVSASSNLMAQYNLTVDSLINLFNALKDYSGTGTTQTLRLGSVLLNKLTSEQKLIAINKGWTLS